MDKDEALRLALEALQNPWKAGPDGVANAIIAIKAALEAKDEPVAWRAWVSKFPQGTGSDWVYVTKPIMKDSVHNQPLYTTPPQRIWVELTDDEIEMIYAVTIKIRKKDIMPGEQKMFAKTIQHFLKERNT
jgi:hypothetical protein